MNLGRGWDPRSPCRSHRQNHSHHRNQPQPPIPPNNIEHKPCDFCCSCCWCCCIKGRRTNNKKSAVPKGCQSKWYEPGVVSQPEEHRKRIDILLGEEGCPDSTKHERKTSRVSKSAIGPSQVRVAVPQTRKHRGDRSRRQVRA